MNQYMKNYVTDLELLGGIECDGDELLFEDGFFPPLDLDANDNGVLYVDDVPYGNELSPEEVWANIMAHGLTKSGVPACVEVINGELELKVTSGGVRHKITTDWESVKSAYLTFSPGVSI